MIKESRLSAWKRVDWGGKVSECNWKWGRKGEWQWLSAIMREASNEKTEWTKRGTSLSVLSHSWMFPVMRPLWLLKVYIYSWSNQAEEGKKDPIKAPNASPGCLGGRIGPRGVGGKVQGGATCVCAACLFVLQASWPLLAGHFGGPLIVLFPAVLMASKWEL